MTSMLNGTHPGLWWLPGDQDSQVAGVLSIDYDDARLELIGSFEKDAGRLFAVHRYAVIHGVTTGGLLVTIANATVVKSGFPLTAINVGTTVLRSGLAFIGGHYDEPFAERWGLCSLDLERLTAWASPAGFSRSVDLTQESRLGIATLRYEPPESVECTISGASVTIGPNQQISGDLMHEAKITVNVTAEFTFDEAATFGDLTQQFVKPFIDLVVLAVQKPTSIVKLSVGRGSDDGTQWVEIVSRRLAPEGDEPKALYPMDALFLLPDLVKDAANGVELWYAANTSIEAAFDLVTAVRTSRDLFVSHRMLNAVTAAESYHETRFDGRVMNPDEWKLVVEAAVGAAPTSDLADQVRSRLSSLNKPSLRDRIQGLVDEGGIHLRNLLPDPDGIASRVSKMRNDLAHAGSAPGSGGDMFYATEELLTIMDFHFLGELGFAPLERATRIREASRSHGALQLRDESGLG